MEASIISSVHQLQQPHFITADKFYPGKSAVEGPFLDKGGQVGKMHASNKEKQHFSPMCTYVKIFFDIFRQ